MTEFLAFVPGSPEGGIRQLLLQRDILVKLSLSGEMGLVVLRQ